MAAQQQACLQAVEAVLDLEGPSSFKKGANSSLKMTSLFLATRQLLDLAARRCRAIVEWMDLLLEKISLSGREAV